jgi:ribosomal-protein-alanine N-acetyltransferase
VGILSRRKKGSETAASAELVISPMQRKHVREVLEIEQQIFPKPWSSSLYYSELAQHSTRMYYVATVEGKIVGYVGCMLITDEGHITTIGVAPSWHRRGLGTRLLHKVATAARERGARSLTLEVRMSNHGAQELYRAFGFVPAGIRKNYYAEVNEDGLVMWASDVDTPAYGHRLDALLAAATAPRPHRHADHDETHPEENGDR